MIQQAKVSLIKLIKWLIFTYPVTLFFFESDAPYFLLMQMFVGNEMSYFPPIRSSIVNAELDAFLLQLIDFDKCDQFFDQMQVRFLD